MTNSKKKNNVAAVVPFYNESSTVNQVILQSLKYVSHIIAVDDGSTDDSLQKISQNKSVTVIRFDDNCGKGSALAAGLSKGTELGFDILITIDADLQHNPVEIPLLISELELHDIVIGNRLNDVSLMPLQRRMSNKITSYLLSKKTGQKLLDSQCGFRAYSSKVINNINTKYSGYEAESEMLVLASRKNFKIGFVDISTIYGDEKSKMNPFKAIFGFIKILFI
ncbi:glycosyltransferase family 2 protein [Bacteroidota bacterium]